MNQTVCVEVQPRVSTRNLVVSCMWTVMERWTGTVGAERVLGPGAGFLNLSTVASF